MRRVGQARSMSRASAGAKSSAFIFTDTLALQATPAAILGGAGQSENGEGGCACVPAPAALLGQHHHGQCGQHRHRLVEQTQHVDGVQAFGEAEDGEEERGQGARGDGEAQRQRQARHVQQREQGLRGSHRAAGEPAESRVDVHEAGRVHERACAPP